MCGGGKYHIKSSARKSIINMQGEARNIELRNLSLNHKLALANILSKNDNWSKLFVQIPKNVEDIGRESAEFVSKYEIHMARDIEDEANRQGSLVAMVLFDEWGTSGQIRPTIQHLYELLNRIPLFRASEYIAKYILNCPLPERPSTGPGHKIDISLPTPSCNIDSAERMLEGCGTVRSTEIKRGSVPGANHDPPIPGDLIKKNVMPEMPPNESQSKKIATVEENRPESNGIEIGTGEQVQEGSGSTEIGVVSNPNWSVGNSSELPLWVMNGSVSSARNSRETWSLTDGENPRCIMDSPTTSNGSGQWEI